MWWRSLSLALATACTVTVSEGPPCGDPEVALNDDGFPQAVHHCGSCGVDCSQVLPFGTAWDCRLDDSGWPRCVITACPPGSHLVDDSLCVADQRVLCLPCESDSDCTVADPEARCVELAGGQSRCGSACGAACPSGFECATLEAGEQCVPLTGYCGCTPHLAGQLLGCRVESPLGGPQCAGNQTCDGDQLSPCVVSTPEICNHVDDNCDGQVDEGFLTGGQYLSDDHCGACNHPCRPHLDSVVAACELVEGEPACVFDCREGFVDTDDVMLNGCECETRAPAWPPAAHGVDADCDGTTDPTDDNVYVSKNGDDAHAGTLAQPVASIGRGITIAAPLGRTVFVSQGIYDEQVEVHSGVSVYGGYRSDFLARDLLLFPVVVTHTAAPGHPALVAVDIDTPTVVDGLAVVGTDAVVAGGGSTAVLVRNSTGDLELTGITVTAGRGADGRDGLSSAARLVELGVPSLAALDGIAGGAGEAGFDAGTFQCIGQEAAPGPGGVQLCPVSGAAVNGGDGGAASCPATGCVIGSPCGNGGCSDYTVDDVCDFEAVLAAAVPNPVAAPGLGPAGGNAGPLTYDAPTTRVGSNFCDDNPTLRREGGGGGEGGPGTDGVAGVGYHGATAFHGGTGIWRNGDGGDGGDGTDGSGGGGGTQGNGYDVLVGGAPGANDQLGGAGGGGGSGGCGAPGARGGQGGGGSIGVAVVLAGSVGPVFRDVRVEPNSAGDGGGGGVGASGGSPGAGGRGGDGNHWCARRGGAGGDGGRGGAGGGGGGGGAGSISGFHVVAPDLATGEAYVQQLEAANQVGPLPALAAPGRGGYSPGAPGSDGAPGDAKAFRVQL